MFTVGLCEGWAEPLTRLMGSRGSSSPTSCGLTSWADGSRWACESRGLIACVAHLPGRPRANREQDGDTQKEGGKKQVRERVSGVSTDFPPRSHPALS